MSRLYDLIEDEEPPHVDIEYDFPEVEDFKKGEGDDSPEDKESEEGEDVDLSELEGLGEGESDQ